jgi:hypothetical protein
MSVGSRSIGYRSTLVAMKLGIVIALMSGCAASSSQENDTASADMATANPNGGLVFRSESDMRTYFRDIALVHGKFPELGCAFGAGATTTSPSLDTCSYDPTTMQVTPAQWMLSDAHHRFIGPDSHRYGWVYIAVGNTYVFADRDLNPNTYALIDAYNTNVFYMQDWSTADQYMAPIEAWLDARK